MGDKIFDSKSFGIMLILTVALSWKTHAQSGPVEDSLNPKQQSLITISAQTAKGNLTALKANLNAGLDAGLTVNQIKEALLQTYAYCGFPRSIRGLQTFMTVTDERKAKGINDIIGVEATPITAVGKKFDRGKAILEKLTGVTETGPKNGYAAFAPTMEVFLKEHLFADIFERDILTYQDRELVTISVISSIGDADPMLRSHLAICMNIGLSPIQLQQFLSVVKPIIGKKKSQAAQKVVNQLLTDNKKG